MDNIVGSIFIDGGSPFMDGSFLTTGYNHSSPSSFNFTQLIHPQIGIWDLWAMRAGTGRMLFEEIVLTKSEIIFPTSIVSSHWLSDPINQVFPQAMEVALNITYLVLALFGWPPASLFAFASVMLTLGQTLSLLAQVYFYPNFLSNPIRLSTVSWVLVLIFRVIIPSVNGFVVCKKLCSLLVDRGRSF
ncbi:hypothetical protein DFH05DRAFT_1529275 [Lentinula detonsa]|uniref:Uncharacterized protein n=1 Tax=Lentinula detonsa TaxID=2804962 RepID=A0A9W8NTN7_9AGAR|nr:hypothetical protein DFH05DRAFT_1529275 [Lentinula detonsa]